MGLIISVILVCVGVYEFVQLFCDAGGKVECQTKKICSIGDESIKKDPTPKIKLCRDFLSHEDVEVECPSHILHRRSGTPSPSRFLVTEKQEDRSRSSSPRKFVISAESEANSNLREFFITKSIPKDDPGTKRYVLIDTRDEFREVSPLPLPKQFVITQNKATFSQEKLETFKQGIGVQLNSINLDGQNIGDHKEISFDTLEKKSIENSSSSISWEYQTTSDYGKSDTLQKVYTQQNAISSSLYDLYAPEPAEFHRDASPYPSLSVSVRKGSITSELLENPNISEIDEDAYNKSSKVDVILNSRNGTTIEYWSNKVLVEPSTQYESGMEKPESSSMKTDNSCLVDQNQCKIDSAKTRSKSATRDDSKSSVSVMRKVSSSSRMFDEDFQEPSGLFMDVLERGGDESFRDSLDGVKKGQEAKRSFRKKRNKSQNSLENTHEHCEEKNYRVQGQSDVPENTWLIFSGEYTKAMNKDWHGQHFCCWQCDESLTGQRYVLRDDHPYCVSCYESVFANACEKCSRTIGIDSKDLSYKDKHWHEACFLCTTCGESLVDKQFGSKGERIYCGRCYDNQFASRCDGCNEIFRAGTKKMEYKTRQWHEKCFCCCVCKVPIGTQSFIPREQEIYCAKCYEEKFATRCIKCNKVITSGGVTYKNEPWHRECFTCTHCSKSLAGERFTSRDDKPYCAECFGELFAKRCFACNKPITGIGGTKFISFEDRHWHNDCFFCASCRTSLVGRGFITDQEDIICPDCAKQKLL